MKSQANEKQKFTVGVAAKIALFSWLLALVTLLSFVSLTIPQQKQNYLESLNSKANSVAVSLYDVAAGAAINDDLASVVSACQTLLQGDDEIGFLIVTKNDGFSLVNQQSGWRVESDIGEYWYPEIREAHGSIEVVPVFEQEIYHYSRPFDYSGIQWGWIHVGLSLDRYNEYVQSLYQNTLYLVLICMLVSLVCAAVFSRQLVRPILQLREVVEQVAGGHLYVLAEAKSNDELGNLSIAVNTMIRNLIRRNQVLETVRFSAQHFMQVFQWEDAITTVLEKFGYATETIRVSFFLNEANTLGESALRLKYQWSFEDPLESSGSADQPMVSYLDAGLADWLKTFEKKQFISGDFNDFSEKGKILLKVKGSRSFISVPVFTDSRLIGFILVESKDERLWNQAEIDSLLAIAEILGATILRQLDRSELVKAKQHLEERVEQRTEELKNQVEAKESALAELADAQSSLVEMSRAAGMAEVATGVLHNVGNVLNSVNVSCQLINEQLHKSRIGNIEKLAELLTENKDDLAHYLTADERGRQIPEYLISLAPALKEEQTLIGGETNSLRERIDHIKEIVSMQQSYGQVSGIYESIAPQVLMEDALHLNEDALLRHEIEVTREYEEIPAIDTDKHKVLQILLNLVQNAKDACCHGNNPYNMVILRLFKPDSESVAFQVQDNGIGILEKNLTKIFQHGFTTKQGGHGFGLHSGAITAKELGGELTAYSEGINKGALFTLTLPLNREP